MNRTVAEIIAAMTDELGCPSPETELSEETMTNQWNYALEEFNERVGNLSLRLFAIAPGQQLYKLANMFPTLPTARKVTKVYFYDGAETPFLDVAEVYASATEGYYDYDDEAASATTYIVRDEDASLNLIADMKYTNSRSVFQKKFKFIDPSTVLLIPAPPADASGTLLCVVISDYDTTTLPQKYERLVTDYAKALCQEIIANARASAATPMRFGDFVRYASREKYQYSKAEQGRCEFERRCNEIIANRLTLLV